MDDAPGEYERETAIAIGDTAIAIGDTAIAIGDTAIAIGDIAIMGHEAMRDVPPDGAEPDAPEPEAEPDAMAARRKKLLEAIARIKKRIQDAHDKHVDVPDAVAKMYVELVEKLQKQLDFGEAAFDREFYGAELIDIRLDSAISDTMLHMEQEVDKYIIAADDIATEISRMEYEADRLEHALTMSFREAESGKAAEPRYVREIAYVPPMSISEDWGVYEEPVVEEKEKPERIVYDANFAPDGDEKKWKFFTLYLFADGDRDVILAQLVMDESEKKYLAERDEKVVDAEEYLDTFEAGGDNKKRYDELEADTARDTDDEEEFDEFTTLKAEAQVVLDGSNVRVKYHNARGEYGEKAYDRYSRHWFGMIQIMANLCISDVRRAVREAGTYDAGGVDNHNAFLAGLKVQVQDSAGEMINIIDLDDTASIAYGDVADMFGQKIEDFLTAAEGMAVPPFKPYDATTGTGLYIEKVKVDVADKMEEGLKRISVMRHIFRLSASSRSDLGAVNSVIAGGQPQLADVFMIDGKRNLWSMRDYRADGTRFLGVYADDTGAMTVEKVRKYDEKKAGMRIYIPAENALNDGTFGIQKPGMPPMLYMLFRYCVGDAVVNRDGGPIIVQYEHEITMGAPDPATGRMKFEAEPYDVLVYCDIVFPRPGGGDSLKLVYNNDAIHGYILWYGDWYDDEKDNIFFAYGTETRYIYMVSGDERKYLSFDGKTVTVGARKISSFLKKDAIQHKLDAKDPKKHVLMIGRNGIEITFTGDDPDGINLAGGNRAAAWTNFWFVDREPPGLTDPDKQRYFGSGLVATARKVGGFMLGTWHLQFLWAVAIVLAIMVAILLRSNAVRVAAGWIQVGRDGWPYYDIRDDWTQNRGD